MHYGSSTQGISPEDQGLFVLLLLGAKYYYHQQDLSSSIVGLDMGLDMRPGMHMAGTLYYPHSPLSVTLRTYSVS